MAREAKTRILVVDDDRAGCHFLRELLQHEGYFVDVETDPAEALVRAHETPYGLVVSDVVMPGISGTVFVAQLRCVRPELPAVLVSAFPDERTLADARALGIPLLAKPFRADTLLALIADLLAAHPERRTSP